MWSGPDRTSVKVGMFFFLLFSKWTQYIFLISLIKTKTSVQIFVLYVMALDMGGIFVKTIAFCLLQIANMVSITRDVIPFFLKPLNDYHGTPPIHV
jgi:hypothetical protein